jgi:hypothetical protein
MNEDPQITDAKNRLVGSPPPAFLAIPTVRNWFTKTYRRNRFSTHAAGAADEEPMKYMTFVRKPSKQSSRLVSILRPS